MKYLIWNEAIMLKGYEFIKKLIALDIEFVVMGGWAVYFLTEYHMSKDIDLMIRDREFWKLKNYIMGLNGREKTTNLPKTGFALDDVELDVYTESRSGLAIPVKDVFSKSYFLNIKGVNVLKPEVLLILKAAAEKERSETMKGFKDRCDMLAILMRSKLDSVLLRHLSEKYGCKDAIGKDVTEQIAKIIKNSQREFEYVLQKAIIPSKLKKLKKDLTAKLVT